MLKKILEAREKYKRLLTKLDNLVQPFFPSAHFDYIEDECSLCLMLEIEDGENAGNYVVPFNDEESLQMFCTCVDPNLMESYIVNNSI